MYIDVHAHLDLLKNLDEVIKKIEEKEVEIVIAHGVNHRTNVEVLKLRDKYSIVEAALGIYPSDGIKMSDKEVNSEINFIQDNADKIVAIGEIGIDGTYGDIEKQKHIFEKMISLSIMLDLPMIVHSRKAEQEAIEILEKLGAKKVIMHCFCGRLALVERIIKNGWYLSIPSNVTISDQFQQHVNITPTEQLFGETDSPFLHPEKKFPNDPSNVRYSYKKISDIKGLSIEEVKEKLKENYDKLFS